MPSPLPTHVVTGLYAERDQQWRGRLTELGYAKLAEFPPPMPGEMDDGRDSPLHAAVLRDPMLAAHLTRLYLDPLRELRDGGQGAKEALRAYFAAGCNASVAAATLCVNRRTVATRLEVAEETLGCSLHERSAEIQAALMLEREEGKPSKYPGPRGNLRPRIRRAVEEELPNPNPNDPIGGTRG